MNRPVAHPYTSGPVAGMSSAAPTGYSQGGAAAGMSAQGWMLCALAVLSTLTLSAVKIPIGFDLRLGQLALAGTFFLLFLHDLHHERVPWGPLFALVGCGVLLSALSHFSLYPKVKEITFVIKYVVVFPMAFYAGVRFLPLLGAQRLAMILELVLLFGTALAVFLHFHPIAALIHKRPEHLSYGLKGSFWEQDEFAFFLGLFLIASLALRLEYQHWPQRRWPIVLIYVLTIGCALASYNKTIWIALIGAFLGVALLYRSGSHISGVARAWTLRLALIAILGAVALAAYNEWLPAGEKLVTTAMLQNKWDNERGAALRVAWSLIWQAPWLGHGFGFVEAYFDKYPFDIVGLGGDSAQLFNSYLDLWLSAGFLGLVYGLGLLYLVFSTRSLFSILLVIYLFISANTNPVAQYEYYYIFLGLTYAASRAARSGQITRQHMIAAARTSAKE